MKRSEKRTEPPRRGAVEQTTQWAVLDLYSHSLFSRTRTGAPAIRVSRALYRMKAIGECPRTTLVGKTEQSPIIHVARHISVPVERGLTSLDYRSTRTQSRLTLGSKEPEPGTTS